MAMPNEIIKRNYESRLEELIELVQVSDFVAIDCTVETTGFLLPDETFNPAYMKDVDDWNGWWYDNIKAKEKTHCLIEVGVALFKRHSLECMELEAEVFNIPVLPACIDDNEIARFRGRTSVRLQFDGHGQEFIRQVDFDLNKVFYMATPYLNRELQTLADSYMIQNPNFMVATRKRRLNKYLIPELFEEITETERKSVIERLKGVSKVFEAISRCKIPVVGHHLLLKLMFIFKDFFEYLPDTYPEYVDKIDMLFPMVYDTKQMANDLLENYRDQLPERYLQQLQSSKNLNLYELIKNVSSCKDLIETGYTLHVGARSEDYIPDLEDLMQGINVEDDTDGFCYVAGFDALACGTLFLDFVHLMEKCKLNFGQVSKADYLGMLLKEDEAAYWKNKIYKAPQLPVDKLDKTFLELVQAKKNFWHKKRLEAEKEKAARAVKPLVTLFKDKESQQNKTK